MITTEPVTEAFSLVYSLEFCLVMIITFSSLCRGLNRRIRLGLSETEELVCFGVFEVKDGSVSSMSGAELLQHQSMFL